MLTWSIVKGTYQRYVYSAVITLMAMIGWVFLLNTHVQAGVYYIRLNAPTDAAIGSDIVVTLTTNTVVDAAATGYVSGTVTYPTSMVKLQNIAAGDYPAVTVSGDNGTINVSSPDKGAGKGYGGRLTIFTATFRVVGSGTANFAVSDGVMYVNGTHHTAYAATTTIPSVPCPNGMVGTYPNCSAPATTTATPTPSATTAPSSGATTQGTTTTGGSSAATSSASPVPTPKSADQVSSPRPAAVSTGSVTIKEQNRDITRNRIKVQLYASGTLRDITARYGTSQFNVNTDTDIQHIGSDMYLDVRGLDPGRVYYLQLEAKDNAGKLVTYSNNYATVGFPIRIALLRNGQKLANTRVHIGGSPYTSDAAGLIQMDLSPGSYIISDVSGEHSDTLKVVRQTVAGDADMPAQEFTFTIPAAAAIRSMTLSQILQVLATVAVTALAVGFAAVMRIYGWPMTLWERATTDDALSTESVIVGSFTHNNLIRPKKSQAPHSSQPDDDVGSITPTLTVRDADSSVLQSAQVDADTSAKILLHGKQAQTKPKVSKHEAPQIHDRRDRHEASLASSTETIA